MMLLFLTYILGPLEFLA